ncbi:uncharacterized protein V1510DRAFT_443942, partial [Dipodascopsis tothii]|uniref:uncharacterized protein n=1 Tax=Dipodascopsis tothii TaxID=44089 RepID=UPI0034CD8F00
MDRLQSAVDRFVQPLDAVLRTTPVWAALERVSPQAAARLPLAVAAGAVLATVLVVRSVRAAVGAPAPPAIAYEFPPEIAVDWPHTQKPATAPPQLRDPARPDRINAFCPATGLSLGALPISTRADIDAAVAAAAAAQASWKLSSFAERRR